MFKTIALGSVAALSLGAGAALAGNIGGWEVISLDESNSRYSVDRIVIQGPSGVERINVVCGQGPYDSAHDWESYGPNSADWVDYVAKEWCF